MNEVTQLLRQIDEGKSEAAAQLLPIVYQELRRLAAQRLANEPAGQTLQATALVHEAYVRLVDTEEEKHWNGRGHFFASAAEAMRRILVENARRRASLKRGGHLKRVPLDPMQTVAEFPDDDLCALSEALDHLAEEDPAKAELVKLRYFAGLSHQEAAQALGISRATADRYWAYAKVRLYCDVHGPDENSE